MCEMESPKFLTIFGIKFYKISIWTAVVA